MAVSITTEKKKRRIEEEKTERNIAELGMITTEPVADSLLVTPHASLLSKPVFVRPYQSADYPVALALWQEANLRPFLEHELERLLGSGGGALVAVVPQEDSNAVSSAIQSDVPIKDTVVGIVLWSHNGSVGILWRLAVAETQRGRGIATKLLDRAEQDIREAGLSGVTLLTRVTNTVAKSMYTKRGYKWSDHLEFWGKKLSETTDVRETVHSEATGASDSKIPTYSADSDSTDSGEEQTSC